MADALEIHGLSLPHYAAVRAALAEGFREAEVLRVEGIEPRRWSRADPAWKLRLVDDPAVFAAYRDALVAAEDWLARDVAPVGDDLSAWASLLEAMAAGGAGLFVDGGLGPNDVARLGRRWARAAERDPKVHERLAELRRKPAPLPPLRVAPAELRPSRHARGRAEEAAAEATVAARSEPALALDRYAALCAELAERPGDAMPALSRYGLQGEGALAALDARWQAEMAADPALAADFRRLFAHNRARLATPSHTPSAEAPERAAGPSVAQTFGALPPVLRSALRGTALFLEIPRGPALPFVAGPEAPAPAVASPAQPAPRPAGGSLTGTSLALDVPSGPALPFADTSPPAAPIPGAPPVLPRSPFAETSLQLDIPRALVLPFAPGAVVEAGEPAAKLPEVAPRGPLTGTSLALEVPPAAALPFAGDATAAKPPVKPAPPALTGTSLALDVPSGPALPFVAGNAPPAVSSPSPVAVAPRPAPAELARTAALPSAARAPELPFARGAPGGGPAGGKTTSLPAVAPPSKLARASLSLDIPPEIRALAARVSGQGTAAPAPMPSAPSLTVEQYASLCVELAVSPAEAAATLARYRVSAAEKQALDRYYGERVAREPAVREAWEKAYRTYGAWLREARGGGA